MYEKLNKKSSAPGRRPPRDEFEASDDPRFTGTDVRADSIHAACPREEPLLEADEDELVVVRAALFFDGTRNNRTNVGIGPEGSPDSSVRKSVWASQSYENDLSNLARLAGIWLGDEAADHNVDVYVEGAGTIDAGVDDKDGFAFGSGETGVVFRVQVGIDQLIERIKELELNMEDPIALELDAFGFSRGAASARNYIHAALFGQDEGLETKHRQRVERERTYDRIREAHLERYDTVDPDERDLVLIAALPELSQALEQSDHGKPAFEVQGTPLKERLRDSLGIDVRTVNVRFVGIYDTVSSYGGGPVKGPNFENDTQELHLDAICNAEWVVHLCSAEEHRVNFSLTRAQSAVDGLELFLPGAHSDVGGGYKDNSSEIDYQVFDVDEQQFDMLSREFVGNNSGIEGREILRAALARDRQYLLDAGWYRADEEVGPGSLVYNAFGSLTHELKFTRRNISNGYSMITLRFMMDYAEDYGIGFKRAEADEIYAVPAALEDVEERLRRYIAAHSDGGSEPAHWLESREPWLRALRHDALHFSARFGEAAHWPRFTFVDDERGEVWDPVRGTRARRIHDG